MKAFVFSIGEPTTEACVWSLERQGFDVEVVKDSSPLWAKLQYIFGGDHEEDILRVDADVICNKNVQKLVNLQSQAWYIQCYAWDWLKQDLTHSTPSFIRKEALPAIRNHLEEIIDLDRPETYLTRLPEFYSPRRHETANLICGLHGYAQDDYERVKRQKDKRRNDIDWELFEKVQSL